jgi:methyl-accepting chemotaxis protein
MLQKLSISHRLMLFIPVLLVSLAATIWFGLTELRHSLIEDRKESIKQLVQLGTGVVDDWYQQEKSGQLSREQAEKGARDALWRLRYGDNNYLFVSRYDGVQQVQLKRDLEGQNRLDATDPDGVPTVRLLIDAARRGGDYVYYRASRTGGASSADPKNAVPKLTYAAGFAPWEWAIGTGVYIDDIDSAFHSIAVTYAVLGFGLLLVSALLAHLLARVISGPLTVITERMSRLAADDLSVDVPFTDDPHEIGRLARALEIFKANRRKAVEMDAVQQAQQAAKLRRQEAVEELIAAFHTQSTRVIEGVVGAAERVNSHAGNLAALATQSQTRIAAVNRAATDTTGNVQTIAGAAEELTSAVDEVAQQVGHSAGVAARAVAEADQTSEIVLGLAAAAQRIGEVVKLINDIASQTNLLALNATIEAARAGDAGKGFAVVASEVKALANQTTRATEEIEAQITGIQSETTRAVAAISNIGATVSDMRSIATGIASAMTEQGATTQEIARNIGEAALGTQGVSNNIAGVADAAEVTNRAAAELRGEAHDLRSEATSLSDKMVRFFEGMRAA